MDYKYFTFDGVSSQKYNIIIMNNGEDLSYPARPAFENQMVSPLYQGTSYLTGVNKKDRVFNFNCWVDSVTDDVVRSINTWLSSDKIGKLVMEYNPNFYYNVKINSVSDWKHMAINLDGTVNYEFSLSFTTIGDFAAISNNSFTATSGNNPNGYPVGYASGSDLYFYNTYSLPFYMDFTIVSTGLFSIKKNDVVHYQYNKAGTFTLNSKYGFCLDSNNNLIEKSLSSTATFTNRNTLQIDSDIKYTTATVTAGSVVFPAGIDTGTSIRFFVANKTNAKLYSYAQKDTLITDLGLVNGSTILLAYIYPTKITLSTGITYSFRYRDSF